MNSKYNVQGLDDYEIDIWIERLGSTPVSVVISEDMSEPYEMNRAYVLQLKNGQYALVTESGCSCYSIEDACIDLFPNKTQALKSFTQWVRENSRD